MLRPRLLAYTSHAADVFLHSKFALETNQGLIKLMANIEKIDIHMWKFA